MALFQATAILACFVYVVLMNKSTTGQNMSFLGSACNGRGIDLTSNYAHARDLALKDAVEHTPDIGFSYDGRSRYMNSLAYSHGECNGEIIFPACEHCMMVARRYLVAYCVTNTEGWVKLEDCLIGFWEFPNV